MIDELMFAVKLEVVKKLVQPGNTLDVGCGDKVLLGFISLIRLGLTSIVSVTIFMLSLIFGWMPVT